MNTYIHSQHEHMTPDTWLQNLLHLKKAWNVDVWMQQFYQQQN